MKRGHEDGNGERQRSGRVGLKRGRSVSERRRKKRMVRGR